MTEIEQLQDLRDRLRERMRGVTGWDAVQPHLTALGNLNAQTIAEGIVPGLTESFALWAREEMTGEGGQEPLGAVVFEWSEDEYRQSEGARATAFGYGYGQCVEKAGSVFIPRPEYDLTEPRFGECGGIEIGPLLRHYREWDEETESIAPYFNDLLSLGVAEAVHHAMAQAIRSESFAALNKRDEVSILVREHSRFAALAYRWRRQR